MNEPGDVIRVIDPADGRHWQIDADFLRSNWECRWGCDCVGILDDPAPELEQGCCSVGAELLDADEAMQISALAMTLDPARFQHHAGDGAGLDSYFDAAVERTLVVDGACVFLNRPGFAGGSGCALHLAALGSGESPTDWKPAICWQLPLKVVDDRSGGVPVGILRRWERTDWGPGGADMAWVCTERATATDANGDHDPADPSLPSAYVGSRPVIESMADELETLLGPSLFALVEQALVAAPAKPEDDS